MNIKKVVKIMSIELEETWINMTMITIFYFFLFFIRWINTKDGGANNLDSGLAFLYIFGIPIAIAFKSFMSKNNTVSNEVEQMLSILPIEEEERILGRTINSGLLVYSMIIPFLIMYILPPSVPQMVGLRGGLLIFGVYVVVWATIRNISKYDKKYIIPNRILNIGSIIILLLHLSSYIIEESMNILDYLYSSQVYMIIGNTYVGIILGILTLIVFFYFNFTYVLKGIKNNRWQIR